jgi:Concanavalin A-like lectin/glucanases superfamily/Domain of unknown function (DUF2341)/Carbohydrate esterase, sialic acid-specific acetylesterase/Glucose-regulated metallo-peptidase M90
MNLNSCIAIAGLALFAGVTHVDSAEPPQVTGRQTKKIEGWTLLISDELLEKDAAATERALELLTVQLQEIDRVIPAKAVAELRKVPLWFSPEYPKSQPRAEYHPGAGWLRDNKRDPAMEKGVEFTNVRIFERETKRMPNFALHELAHAYHDRVLPGGFGNEEIKSAYENAKSKGLYDKVEQRFGDGRSANVRAYAMTNPMEYFAECSEAFFSTNDFFPFNREQLAKHDPEMFALLKKLWGAEEDEPKTTEASLSDWKHSGSMWLLTTPEGADLPAEAAVDGFPVLVRLRRDFFDFSQAKPNGDDVRFASGSGERLAYQIDEWNADEGVASIWVRVPKITGNSRQEIKLHWGNANAKSESDGRAVFNESNGYLSVWHMGDTVQDDAGTLNSTDTGTTPTAGAIGTARHFLGGKGVFGGDKIPNYPTGAGSHSTEVWFRPERPNTTLVGWGNEQAQGKVVMQFRSPPHIQMDCYFSGGNVGGTIRAPWRGWTHVVHTYQEGEARLYVNGVLDGTNIRQGGPLNIRTPARLWIGGWYNNYDFVGDLDEVRVSNVVRSAEWIKLQYENQKANQTLVGLLVQPGNEFSVSQTNVEVDEGKSITLTAIAGGAQKVDWLYNDPNLRASKQFVAADRLAYTFHAGRVSKNSIRVLTVKAVYPNEVKSQDIAIQINNVIPEPEFTFNVPATWDGRTTMEVAPQITNLPELKAKGVDELQYKWWVNDVAVIKEVMPGKLILKRAQGSGTLRLDVAVSNGGIWEYKDATIDVKEPAPNSEPWISRPIADVEQPEDNQFIARDSFEVGKGAGKIVYAGRFTASADSAFVRVISDEKVIAAEMSPVRANESYKLTAPIPAGLIKYRTEFGTKVGDTETILHSAKNIVCGDVFLINGQSNAVATDFGKENPLVPSDWVRTFGATAGDPNGSRLKLWGNAEARSPGGKSEIGYWGLELGRRLVESEKIPVCIINGAVGGTRIDQHQRNEADPTDVTTIYGRLLWRVQQAKLTHGVRAVIWHQGENDQGADGPTGGYGYETYRQFFVDLAAGWKQDFPNVQHYYAFQIWPKSCSMGINGSDNRLREVQRTLPKLFSNMDVMSTLGVKPPGGCHFPAAGYAEFARLIEPLIERDLYQRKFSEPITPPNLERACFTTSQRDELMLQFDQPVVWSDALVNQFHLDGEPKQVTSGSAEGNRITLKLKSPSKSKTVTYLDSASWNPDNLLYGKNGLAALTFCEVQIEE